MVSDNKQYKELKVYLKNITEGTLRELIGQGICDAIVHYNLYINNLQVDYIEILENKFGKNILFEKNVVKINNTDYFIIKLTPSSTFILPRFLKHCI